MRYLSHQKGTVLHSGMSDLRLAKRPEGVRILFAAASMKCRISV
jgi:hypothetical protein